MGQGMQEMPNSLGFVRAEMLASGVLIRPCEQGGGSVVMAIDDMNFMVKYLFIFSLYFLVLLLSDGYKNNSQLQNLLQCLMIGR